jgi:putative Mn2+ efflux pump MntP
VLARIAAFVVPLGFDTFAVAVALGLRGMPPLRPALTFALAEAIMPLVGLVLGRIAGAWFETPAAIAGAILVVGVGLLILKEAVEEEDEAANLSFSSVRSAALAGVAISMDELAIGFPMGTSGLPIVATLAAIAGQAFVVTVLGVVVGRRLGEAFGRRASRIALAAAGLGFIGLGLYIGAERLVPGLPRL